MTTTASASTTTSAPPSKAPSPAPPPAVSVGAVLGPLARPYRWHLALALLLNGIHGVAVTFQNFTLPTLVGILESSYKQGTSPWHQVLWLAVAYCLVSCFGRMLMWHLGYRLFTWVRERVVFQLRANFFRHVNHLCLRFHRNHPSGELFSYLFGSPLAQITQFFQTASLQVPGAVFNLCASLVVLGGWDLYLTGVLCLMVLTSVLTLRHSLRTVRKITFDFQAAEGSVSGHIADLLHGNKAVKIYAMEEHVAHDFEDKAQLLSRKSYERDVKTHIEFMKQETVSFVAFAVLLGMVTWRYQEHAIDLKGVTAYLMFFSALSGPINLIFTASSQWSGAQISIERIGSVLETASTTPEPIGPEMPVPEKGDLVFDHVRFAYARESATVIEDLNLTVPFGQKVAVVGASGAGKSTIIQLLLRLYDPNAGRITIDGVDLRQCNGPNLRRKIGIVPQDPFIFGTNIRDNVRVAQPEADSAAIQRACELSNAWEFIKDLPQGLDTPVGEGGSTLSGGQRQRLAIARVLLANPAFLVFDEATSALDTVSERLIQDSIERSLGGRTGIFIAHRLATVKHCDRILVMKEGRVVQDGPYDQLMAVPGPFRDLVEGQQLRMDEIAV